MRFNVRQDLRTTYIRRGAEEEAAEKREGENIPGGMQVSVVGGRDDGCVVVLVHRLLREEDDGMALPPLGCSGQP